MTQSRDSKGSVIMLIKETREKSNKVSVVGPALSCRLPSRPSQGQIQMQGLSLRRGFLSLSGLLAAQRFSKELRVRAANAAARKALPMKPILITNEQIPASSALPAERFPCAQVSRKLQDFLWARLEDVAYNGPASSVLVMRLSEEVRRLMRTLCPPRYRLVVTVVLGQQGPGGRHGDGALLLASRSLWDAHSDTCVSHTYQNMELFCNVCVFAVYCE